MVRKSKSTWNLVVCSSILAAICTSSMVASSSPPWEGTGGRGREMCLGQKKTWLKLLVKGDYKEISGNFVTTTTLT